MERTKQGGLTANTLKLIAVTAMFLDHLGWWLFTLDTLPGQFIHITGRIVAPVMAFFVAEGFYHTRSVKKYLGRMLLFAALSHLPYVWFFNHHWYDASGVVWGLAMGLAALAAIKSERTKGWQKIAALFLCLALTAFSNWSCTPVLWIVAMGLHRGDFKRQMLWMVGIGWVCYALPTCLAQGWYYAYQFAIVLAVPLLGCYNGARGKATALAKWGFYIFYPLHFLILILLRDVLSVASH